ncbi:MAG: TIGR02757 family protein [Kiritimatiellae bacterium]|nr:TIGR02757 family protein [Kiritimatiellia bacterium]
MTARRAAWRERRGGWRRELERHVRQFHRPERAALDPVGVVRRYSELADREVAGLLAASLAYGSLAQIRRSVLNALARLGGRPAATLDACADRSELDVRFAGFRHRWTTAADVVELLWAIRGARRRWGSLEAAMCEGGACRTLRDALTRFRDRLVVETGGAALRLLPDPRRGSPCKRLLLFLRWMVRCDAVDPGGWSRLSPAQLLIPLDVHTFRAARRWRLTSRRTASWRAAEEITARLADLCAEDPVRYDFALAHAGAVARRTRYRARRSAAPR